MKRKLKVTCKQGEVNPDRETTSLLSLLPPKMVAMVALKMVAMVAKMVALVASHLNVSSYLALASSSIALLDILVSQLQWERLLQRTRMHGKRLDICQFPRVPLEVHVGRCPMLGPLRRRTWKTR